VKPGFTLVLRIPSGRRFFGAGGRPRKIGFSILTVSGVFVVLTLGLEATERLGLIDTSAEDELAFLGHADGYAIDVDRDEVRFQNRSVGQDIRLSAKKPADELRVVLIGGSMAQGLPYQRYGMGGVTDWLQAFLEQSYPDMRPTVFNACVGGLDSLGVAERTKNISRLDPDALIVLSGNNEGLIVDRAVQALHRWIVFRAMRKLLLGDVDPAKRPPHLEPAADAATIDAWLRQNLETVGAITERADIPLVLATMPINMKWSGTVMPAADEAYARRGLGFPRELDADIQSGLRLCEAGDVAGAMASFRRSQDEVVRLLATGQCLEDHGRISEARATYEELISHFPMGRARPSFNETIRQVVQNHDHVCLADVEAEYLLLDPNGLPDPTLWVDNCHMHWRGYGWVATQLFEAMLAGEVLPALPTGRGSPPTLEETIRVQGWGRLLTEIQPDDPGHARYRLTPEFGSDGVRRAYRDSTRPSSDSVEM